MQTVYLGLGANLNAPRKQIHAAVAALKALKDVEFVCVSHDYASKPMGPQDQPDYVNAVACVKTALEPEQLLDLTQAIELEHGRVRKEERCSRPSGLASKILSSAGNNALNKPYWRSIR